MDGGKSKRRRWRGESSQAGIIIYAHRSSLSWREAHVKPERRFQDGLWAALGKLKAALMLPSWHASCLPAYPMPIFEARLKVERILCPCIYKATLARPRSLDHAPFKVPPPSRLDSKQDWSEAPTPRASGYALLHALVLWTTSSRATPWRIVDDEVPRLRLGGPGRSNYYKCIFGNPFLCSTLAVLLSDCFLHARSAIIVDGSSINPSEWVDGPPTTPLLGLICSLVRLRLLVLLLLPSLASC